MTCLIHILILFVFIGRRGATTTLRAGRAKSRDMPPYLRDSTHSALTQRRFYSVRGDASDSVPRLTHIDNSGRPAMVDVSPKDPTKRAAVAHGRIYIPKVAYDLITTPARDAPYGVNQSTSSLSPLDKAKAKARSKGDVLTVAQLAAIMGCKRTAELIPLCHPLQLSHIAVELVPEASRSVYGSLSYPITDACNTEDLRTASDERQVQYSILCTATVTCEGKTGVEMEALTAVSVGLLTVWDMLKAVAGREMIIGDIVVVEKRGGKSGDFLRDS